MIRLFGIYGAPNINDTLKFIEDTILVMDAASHVPVAIASIAGTMVIASGPNGQGMPMPAFAVFLEYPLDKKSQEFFNTEVKRWMDKQKTSIIMPHHNGGLS